MAGRQPETNDATRATTETAREGGLYGTIFASLPDGVVVLRLDSTGPAISEVVDANAAALRILGVASPAFLPVDLPPSFVPLFDREHAALYAESARAGKPRPVGTVAAPDGSLGLHFAVRVLPLSEELVGILFEEITEQVRSERAVLALRSLSERMHSTFDPEEILDILLKESLTLLEAESGIAAFCTPEGLSTFRFIQNGSTVSRNDCYSDGRFLCRSIISATPYLANDLGNDPRADREMAERFHLRSALGTPILDGRAGMIGFLEVHNKVDGAFTRLDEEQIAAIAEIAVTAMKNSTAYQEIALMGRKLEESTERYQYLVEDIDAVVWEADPVTWQFSFVSRQAEKLLGYPLVEWLTNPHFLVEHMAPEDREPAVEYCTRAIENGEDHQLVFRATAADGRMVWLQEIVRVVRDENGTPCCLRGLFLDISDRKIVEQEVADLLVQVRESASQLEKRVAERTSQLEEMNAELKSFAYSVSHDLRAPLRAVQGFAEILRDDEVLSTSGQEAVDRILAAARRMDALIQDLLAYSRITQQELKLSPVDLNKVVSEAITHLRLETSDREILIEVRDPLPTVLGHHPVLVQVVLNLLTNAVKFVAPGVTPQIRIWAEAKGGKVRLFVRDNGIGIAPEHQERIFKIFERLYGNEMYPGTGIGLAIVRKGVTRMDGQIGVQSEPGQGSVFWIELPLPAEDSP